MPRTAGTAPSSPASNLHRPMLELRHVTKRFPGLLGMTTGEILFDGAPIQRDLIAYKQRMGYVPEEPHLYPHLSGLEYLIMVGQLRGLPPKPTADRIDGLLCLFSLHGDRHAPIYSKG